MLLLYIKTRVAEDLSDEINFCFTDDYAFVANFRASHNIDLKGRQSCDKWNGGNKMMSTWIVMVAIFVFIYGMFSKRKFVSVVAALLVICIVTFDPGVVKTFGELAPAMGGPIEGLE